MKSAGTTRAQGCCSCGVIRDQKSWLAQLGSGLCWFGAVAGRLWRCALTVLMDSLFDPMILSQVAAFDSPFKEGAPGSW